MDKKILILDTAFEARSTEEIEIKILRYKVFKILPQFETLPIGQEPLK